MKIVLLGRMAAASHDLLEARLKELGLNCSIVAIRELSPGGEELDLFDETELIVGGPLTPSIVRRSPRLRLFHVFRGSADGLGIEHLAASVPVANTYHHEKAVADFVLMAMLVLTRRPCVLDAQLRSGNWKGSVIWSEPPETEGLDEKTVLIVGLGHIGSEIAIRSRAFGMRVVAVSRKPHLGHPAADDIVGYDTWEDSLQSADYVAVACRLAANTKGLFGRRQFQQMKPSAYFINVARGEVADEEALYTALREKRIAGAAIDVWYQYPDSPDQPRFPSRFPFHALVNVLMSPHCSSWTRQMLVRRTHDVAENVRRLVHGEPLVNLVQRGVT